MSDPDLENLDEEEAREAAKARRKKFILLVAGVLLACVLVLGIAGKSCRGGKKDYLKMERRIEIQKFDSSPADEELANAAIAAAEATGKKDEADRIRKKHAEAVAGQGKGQEIELRLRLAQDPADDEALGKLVELLTKRKDLAGARDVYLASVAKDPTLKRRERVGAWLYRNGFFEPAVKELGAALKAGSTDPYARGYYGLSLWELGGDLKKKKEARHEISQAIWDGADMDMLRQKQYLIEQEIGPEPETEDPPVKPPPRKKRKK